MSESRKNKRPICDYGWIVSTHVQCVEYGVLFHFYQTGARLHRSVPDGHEDYMKKVYEISQEHRYTQGEKAKLDYGRG